jgi:hypothetical protein
MNSVELFPTATASLLAIKFRHLYNRPHRSTILTFLKSSSGLPKGGNVEFVMFEDVDGMEVFVNPERVIWVREYSNQTTVISCGHEDKFAVRLAPAHAVAALGKSVR